MKRTCPLCWKTEKEVLHEYSVTLPEEYHLAQDYQVVSCLHCGMVFQDFEETTSDYNHYYQHCNCYSGVVQTATYDIFVARSAEFIEKHVEKQARILDVGAGAGCLLAALQEKGYKNLYALDPSEESLDVLSQKGFHSIKGDVYQLEQQYCHFFDLVISAGCLEHFMHPREAVASMEHYLCETGLFFLVVPDCSFHGDSLIPFSMALNHEHINQFSQDSLKLLMSQYQWQEVDFLHLIETENAESSYFGLFEKTETTTAIQRRDTKTAEALVTFIEKDKAHAEHCRSTINALVDSGQNLIVWGAGAMASYYGNHTKLLQGNVLAFIDNNPEKRKKTFYDLPVYSPDYLSEVNKPFVLLICLNAREAMEQVVKDMEKNQWTKDYVHFLKSK